jgi:D-alanyl-D-alanine carboxypeptidase
VTSPLQSAWQSVLAEPGIRHALIGGYAYDVTTRRTLAAVHPDWRLTPGSVTKLYATAASLADWKNRFSLVTRVAQARPGGPVYLVGGGSQFATEAKQAMTSPSDVPPFGLYRQLGRHAGADIAALIGRADQVIDPPGNAADDYLTASSISGMLAAIHAKPAEAPLVGLLHRPWIVRLPERTTVAGYATGRGGEPLAYTVIINGQLYNPSPDLPSRYQPQISW